jgi:hypothetical protein
MAQTWEVGGGIGGSGYIGDFNEHNVVQLSGVSLGAYVKRNYNGFFSTKLSYNYGVISGNDSTSSSQQLRDRNLSFITTLVELSVINEFNFFDYIPQIGKNKFTPFIYLGLAAVRFVPKADYNGYRYGLREYKTEGQATPYSKLAFSIPYGAGIKYNFSGAFTLSADIGYRNTTTGYLDDVKGNYPSLPPSPVINKALSDRSGENTGIYIGTPGSQRGNGRNDTYFFTQVGIAYTFNTESCFIPSYERIKKEKIEKPKKEKKKKEDKKQKPASPVKEGKPKKDKSKKKDLAPAVNTNPNSDSNKGIPKDTIRTGN